MSKLNEGWQKLLFSRICSLALCFIIRRCSSPDYIFNAVCLGVSGWCASSWCSVKLIPMPWHAHDEGYMLQVLCWRLLGYKFNFYSNMGELFPSVPDVFLPVGMFLTILFSRIYNIKILWCCSLLVILF